MIKDDRIEQIGAGDLKKEEVRKFDEIIDAKKLVVLPGFINTHVHLGESVFKEFFKGKYSLEHYLKVTDDITKKTDLIEKGRKIIGDYSILNIIKSGTTTICGGRTTELAEQWGIRNVSGYMLMNSFKLKGFAEELEEKYAREYQKIIKTKLSYPAIFIHSLNTFDVSLKDGVRKLLNKCPETRLILHIAETKNQEREIENNFGKSSIGFLNQNGFLNNKTILIHGNWIKKDDLKIIKKCKASLVHCLSSNLKVADKVLNLNVIIKNGIKASIATDGVITSGTFDVLDESKRCFAYHNKNNKRISAQKILDLITIDSAKVLGLGDVIGSLEIGKKADIIFLNKKDFGKNIVEEVVNAKQEIRGVIIDGKLKVWNKRVLMADEKKVINKFRTLTKKIKEEV